MVEKKQVNLIAILVTLVSILFAVSGFFAYQNYSLSKKISKLTQVTNSPISSVAPVVADPTANWKTYIDPQNVYVLKYPDSWKRVPTGEGCGPVFTPSDNSINGWITVCGPYIYQGDKLTNDDMAKISTASGDLLDNQSMSQISNHQVINEVITNAGGLPELRAFIGNVSFRGIFGGPGSSESVQQGTLEVYFYQKDSNKKDIAKEIFDQVLSTFQFTQ